VPAWDVSNCNLIMPAVGIDAAFGSRNQITTDFLRDGK
jgi:hypothetical protein